MYMLVVAIELWPNILHEERASKLVKKPCTTTTEIANIILTLEMSAKFAPLCNALLAIKCCRSAKCQYTALLQHKQQHKHLHESNGR